MATANLPEASADAPNILFVVIDSLRADRLSGYGNERNTSPNLDRLASEGVMFERAFSTAPYTAPSHASLLTGYYPFTSEPVQIVAAITAVVIIGIEGGGWLRERVATANLPEASADAPNILFVVIAATIGRLLRQNLHNSPWDCPALAGTYGSNTPVGLGTGDGNHPMDAKPLRRIDKVLAQKPADSGGNNRSGHHWNRGGRLASGACGNSKSTRSLG